MKKRTKWSVAGAIVLAIVIIGVTSAMKGRNKAVEVRVEKVQRRDLVASVTASGQVQPHTKVDVSADISGRIVRLAVKEGQMVTAGQFLLEIDPSQYRAAVERATAAVAIGAGEAEPDAGAAELRSTHGSQEGEPNARLRRAGGAAPDTG
jgi:HlyD family secretion protein